MKIKAPPDLLIWTGVAVTGIGAAVASFIFLTDLAVSCGWPKEVAPLLPACVDANGATALRIYLKTPKDDELRKLAGFVSVLAVIISMLGNAVSHLIQSGQFSGDSVVHAKDSDLVLISNWAIIMIVGSVPGVALGSTVHLAGAYAHVRSALRAAHARTLTTSSHPVHTWATHSTYRWYRVTLPAHGQHHPALATTSRDVQPAHHEHHTAHHPAHHAHQDRTRDVQDRTSPDVPAHQDRTHDATPAHQDRTSSTSPQHSMWRDKPDDVLLERARSLGLSPDERRRWMDEFKIPASRADKLRKLAARNGSRHA